MDKQNLAYIIGVALGDGNLSNPNGRAVRLRVTCDTRYPLLITRITTAIQKLSPRNKVSIVRGGKQSYCNVSCYSNQWEKLLGWKAKNGSKFQQQVRVPAWILEDPVFIIFCLKGLFETDGSLYIDRGYLMVNFVTVIEPLAIDVMNMITLLGFEGKLYRITTTHLDKFTIRITKNTKAFIKLISFSKS